MVKCHISHGNAMRSYAMSWQNTEDAMLRERQDRNGTQLRFHAILISLPQIRACRVQTRVPALQLREGDAIFGVDLVAVVACHDGIVLLT